MDEQEFLRILRDEPENDAVRLEYLRWLSDNGDSRAPFAHLLRRRLKLQKLTKSIDSQLNDHIWHCDRISEDWLDVAFPLWIRSPIVGRCYTKTVPDAAPFVGLGDHVTPQTVVCLVESMKIFNEIVAGEGGVVTEIAVTNGEPVEYNQILFRLGRLNDPDFW